MTAAAHPKEKHESENSDWTPEDEIQLFLAMEGLRPVGANRFFAMACILHRLSKSLSREFSSESVWAQLRSMYNLKSLDQLEQLPFPNDVCDFSLPEADFPSVARSKTDAEETTVKLANGFGSSGSASDAEVKKNDVSIKLVAKVAVISKDTERERDRDVTIKAKVSTKGDGNDVAAIAVKRPMKRTRGSMSLEPGNSSSPASTPPNVPSTKRRRI